MLQASNNTNSISTPSTSPQTSDAVLSNRVDDHDRTLLESMVRLSLRLRLRGVDLESATGLTGRELDLVALLTESGPTSVKSLVADLRIPRSTMTAIVDRLEERGLVVRQPNPSDRRSVVLESTALARESLLHYRNGVSTLVEHIRRVLDDDEADALAISIKKIENSL